MFRTETANLLENNRRFHRMLVDGIDVEYQAGDRDEVKELLKVASGGAAFTTLQKFAPDPGASYPLLSDRRNIVVIADEAHRSQYGHYAKAKKTGEISYGFSKHLRDALPHASYLGLTGTPIELGDNNTKAVFGNLIDGLDSEYVLKASSTELESHFVEKAMIQPLALHVDQQYIESWLLTIRTVRVSTSS